MRLDGFAVAVGSKNTSPSAMASGGPSTAQAGGGGPRPAPPAQNERVEQKRDLASWWKNFKRGDKKAQETQGTHASHPSEDPARASEQQSSVRYTTPSLQLQSLPLAFAHHRPASSSSHSSTFVRAVPDSPLSTAPSGIFGVPLQQSIRYANVAISLFNDEGQSYIYGYVPIVVAKCGVYLKEKG